MNAKQRKEVIAFLLKKPSLHTLAQIKAHLAILDLEDITEDALHTAISGDLGAGKTFHSESVTGTTRFTLMPAFRAAREIDGFPF